MSCGLDRASSLVETQRPFLREMREPMRTVDKDHYEELIKTVAPSSGAQQGEP